MTIPDDPWSLDFDYQQRITLARSILGHADQTPAVVRALAALNGATIDQLREGARERSA